ncbi:hypothetical protein PFISCL1PPCAC_19535, partial [Pristionchus fissidentatus]
QISRSELFSFYDNSSRTITSFKTECWGADSPVTYITSVKVVCAVEFKKNLAEMWERIPLGAVVVPLESIESAYFRCGCGKNEAVICCPGGYCDRTLGVTKLTLCGRRHQFKDTKMNNLMAELLRDQFEEALYIEEMHGGWDDLTFLHGEDQFGNDYSEYPVEKLTFEPIYKIYTKPK